MSALTSRLSGLFRSRRFRIGDYQPVSLEARRNEQTIQSLHRLANDASRADSESRRRDLTIRRLQTGYRQLLEMIRSVNDHLDGHAQRSDQLICLLQKMPEALASLPETQKNQQRMLEVMHNQFELQNQQSGQVGAALKRIAGSSEQYAQILSLIQQQLDANRENDGEMLGAFAAMSRTMTHMGESSRASTEALTGVVQRLDQADRHIADMVRRQTRQMMMMTIVGWLTAAAALVVAVYVLLR